MEKQREIKIIQKVFHVHLFHLVEKPINYEKNVEENRLE